MTEPLHPTGWHPAPGREPGMAVAQPKDDQFYQYTDSLQNIAPGTVLKTRTFDYRAFGFPTWLKVTQLLYRSTSQIGNPTVNVTSVIHPPLPGDKTKVISYQSAYDSLNQNDEPSYAISGGITLGGLVPNVEGAVFAPLLAEGYTVIVPDTEGQRADFAAGPEYGMNTLDSIRAVLSSSTVGLPPHARVAMLGYSGGAIATEWAAELAPTYAPDVNARLIGAAMGGVLVDPAHNLHYIEGTWFWGGVMAMAIIGIGRAFELDFTPYLTPVGVTVFNEMQTASIVDVLGRYKGLTWQKLIIPAYPTPESLPLYVTAANKLIMGTGGTPTIPLFIGQGASGVLEGTPGDRPGIGAGDGVMIAGDVRTLARDYCAKGVKVHYEQYDALGHISSLAPWLLGSITWIKQRFAGLPAPQNCSSIAAGNSLAPILVPQQLPPD
jgi:Secretory lipase